MKFSIKSQNLGKLLSDTIQYKLSIAQLALDDLPKKMPEEIKLKRYYEMMANIEIFLGFLISSHDALFDEINNKFNLNLEEPSWYDLNSKLRSTKNKNAVRVADLLDSNFTRPTFRVRKIAHSDFKKLLNETILDMGIMQRVILISKVRANTSDALAEIHRFNPQMDSNVDYDEGYYERYFDYSKSHLWISTQMRNEISHGKKIMTVKFSTNKRTRMIFLIKFIHKEGKGSRLFWEQGNDVKEFFQNHMRLSRKLVKDVRPLLP